MSKTDDTIFSITLQQIPPTGPAAEILNIHPPKDEKSATASPSRKRRKISNNDQSSEQNETKSKLDIAKELLISGEDLPNNYLNDETIFPALVESLENDYNQMLNNRDPNDEAEMGNTNSFEDETNNDEVPRATIIQNMKNAATVYVALKKARDYNEQCNINQKKKRVIEEIKFRLQAAQNEKMELLDMIQKQESNMSVLFTNEEDKLHRKQEREFRRFQQSWSSEKKQRNYNKSSETLRLMRRQADLLLITKQYQESIQCEKKAAELEVVEIEQKRLGMHCDYQSAIRKLQEKHEAEKETLATHQKMELNKYQSAKNEDITRIEKKIAKIQTELENANDPNFNNKIKKSYEMEMGSKTAFNRNPASFMKKDSTQSIYARTANQTGSKTSRSLTKAEICVSDFNQVPLPPLNTSRVINRISKRTTMSARGNRTQSARSLRWT